MVGAAFGVSLTANESVNDGVLNATPDNIVRQADGVTFWWADKNGDGTPGDPAAAHLNLVSYNLTRSDTVAPLGITLNLHDGSSSGNITWGGVSGGDIDTFHDSTAVSPIVITNAVDITVRDLKTRAKNWGQNSGDIRVYHSGSFSCRELYAYGLASWMDGGNVVLQGGGPSAGVLQVTYRIITSGRKAGNVFITGYSGASIGSGGIQALKNGANAPGTVTITNIGSGGVSCPLGTITTLDETGQGSIKANVRISTSGAVSVS
ncbi:MAG: hypothetical protein N2255_02735, partial [Kiritimatiellae bacterium]|nr:hypothetical protein [Kiritimatiellia bacterium]